MHTADAKLGIREGIQMNGAFFAQALPHGFGEERNYRGHHAHHRFKDLMQSRKGGRLRFRVTAIPKTSAASADVPIGKFIHNQRFQSTQRTARL